MNGAEDSGRFQIKDRRGGFWRNEINLGNVIQLIILLFTVFFAWAQLDKKQDLANQKLDLYIQNNEKEKALKEGIEKIQQQIRELDAKLDAKSAELRRRIG